MANPTTPRRDGLPVGALRTLESNSRRNSGGGSKGAPGENDTLICSGVVNALPIGVSYVAPFLGLSIGSPQGCLVDRDGTLRNIQFKHDGNGTPAVGVTGLVEVEAFLSTDGGVTFVATGLIAVQDCTIALPVETIGAVPVFRGDIVSYEIRTIDVVAGPTFATVTSTVRGTGVP
jgi:hypothetical protein